MKQVEKTPEITAKLQNAVGDGVDTSNLAVFEAISLNTLPIRKRHPLYTDATHSTQFLSEMASQLNAESLPIYLMHDSDAPTPFGRAFFADVMPNMGESELRTLFWVDKVAHPDIVQKLDNGTIDQVSVSVLPKALTCSGCGFDFMGPESDLFDNILTGTDPKGHVMGQDGYHAVATNLDSWFELSLVGRGGARGARILPRDEQKLGSTTFQRLAASGVDLSLVTLVASAEPMNMDLTKLIAELTDAKAKVTVTEASVVTLNGTITTLTAEVTDLTTKLAAAEAAKGSAGPKQEDLDAAVGALRDVTLKVLVASGKVDAKTDTLDVATCVSTITETSKALAAKLVAGGSSKEATADADKATSVFSGAYRTRS